MTTIRIPEAPAPDAWFNPSGAMYAEIMQAVSAELGGSMDAPTCYQASPEDGDGEEWVCSRPPGHKARHIAIGFEVCAAWPGTHEPTLADLGDPTPPAIPDQPAESGHPGVQVVGEWIVTAANRCTCGYAGPQYGHEPGCGLEPVVKVVDVPGEIDRLTSERDRARDVAASSARVAGAWRNWASESIVELDELCEPDSGRSDSERADLRQRHMAFRMALSQFEIIERARLNEYPHGEEES